MNFRLSGPEAISDGQSAAPCGGNSRPTERRKQRLCIAVRNRKNRDLGDCWGISDSKPLRTLGRTYARRERIAWIYRHVCDRPALNALCWTHGSGRKDITAGVTIVSRIRVDQASDRAMLGSDLWLDPPP